MSTTVTTRDQTRLPLHFDIQTAAMAGTKGNKVRAVEQLVARLP